MKFRDRSTTDILVLLIAGTICFSVLATGAVIATVEILHPTTDTSKVIGSLNDVVNTLIGLLAGFLAGRTDATLNPRQLPPQPSSQPREGDESL